MTLVCYWMTQYSVVWYETMILNGMVQCRMEYYWMAWNSVVWNITEWHSSVVWYDTEWQGAVLYGIILNGMVQYCMVMVWYIVPAQFSPGCWCRISRCWLSAPPRSDTFSATSIFFVKITNIIAAAEHLGILTTVKIKIQSEHTHMQTHHHT